MELLSPHIGLIVWTILTAVYLGLNLLALPALALNKSLDGATKIIWALTIILVPVVGAILFFSNSGVRIRNKRNSF